GGGRGGPQGGDEVAAGAEAVGGRLGQGARDVGLVAGRQRRDVGRALEVAQDQLPHVVAGERPLPGEQVLVDDGQAVLVGIARDDAVERFGGGVDRRDAAGDGGARALQVLDQPEVGDLDVVAHQEEVLRLDVEVLEVVVAVHQVQRLGRL